MKNLSMRLLCAFGLACALPCHASSVDWLLSSHAAARADGSVLDFGLERVPGAAVQMQTGRLVVDVPEVSLKGDRGLDLVISRSHGKVTTGYHSLASWDLESPRLVITTAPSTKLRGDALADGICAHTGDVSNGMSGENPTFTASASGNYAAELSKQVTTLVVNEVNRATADRVLASIVTAVNYGIIHDKSGSNGAYAYQGRLALINGIAGSLNSFTNSIIDNNNWDEISDLKSSTAQSISNVYSGGNRVKVRRASGVGYDSFPSAGSLTSALNENFFQSYRVSNSDDVLVTNSSGVTITYPHSMVRQLVLMYVYLNTLQGVNASASSWVANQTSNYDVYAFESVVDPRKRPIALYLPAQGTRLFYPVASQVSGFPANAAYVSQDNWFISCGAGGSKGMTVHATNGVRYYFPESNRENQTGYPAVYKTSAFPGRVTLYASTVENVNRESYVFEYENLVLGAQPFVGYNQANKILLKSVRHKLDGSLADGGNELLKFIYNKFSAGAYSTNYTTGVGDIVLRKIQRKRGAGYVDWVVYNYVSGKKTSLYSYNSTSAEASLKYIQDAESAAIYLDSVNYINNDVFKYNYGGPYNITGNFPSVSGDALSSTQSYLWFFSDLTSAVYSRKKLDGTSATGFTATWTYTDVAFNTPGYDEAKSYRITKSSYAISNAPAYSVDYSYAAPASGEQAVSVTLPLGKAYTYKFHYFQKGINESPLQGYLKSVALGQKTTTYGWVPSVVIGQKPVSGTSYAESAMENVVRYRQAAMTTSHYGVYGKTVSAFDAYDNPTSLIESGLNGSVPVSRSLSIGYFNADPVEVADGEHWWILGLKKTVMSGGKSLWQADYDQQGAMQYKVVKGVRTDYEYTETQFSQCLSSLSSFEWGDFVSCVANLVFGDYHTGLVYEEKVGGGQLITKFAAYSKGIPQRVMLSNGGKETREVDDYGNVVAFTNAVSVSSSRVYSDSGELTEETPVVGLGFYKIARDGFSLTTTLKAGSLVSMETIESLDGFGRVYSRQMTSDGRIIYKRYELDALGRMRTDRFPSESGASTSGTAYTYDEFDRVKSSANGSSVYTYCYQSCGDDVGSIVKVSNSLGDQVVTSAYYSLVNFSMENLSSMDQQGADGSSLTTSISYDPVWLVPDSSSRGRSSQQYTYYPSGQLKDVADGVSGLTSYTYDSAGRPKTITSNDGVVETREYYGLGDLVLSRSLSGEGGSISYDYHQNGAIKKATGAHASLDIRYDAHGMPDQLTQTLTLPGQESRAYVVGYRYNSFGQLQSLTYPGGKLVDLSAQDGFGAVQSIPGVAESLAYDAYGNLKSLKMGEMSWSRNYTADGRVQGIDFSNQAGCNYKTTFGYDALLRINKVTDNCGSRDGVDSIVRWGTGQVKSVSGDVFSAALGAGGSYAYTYNQDDIASVTKVIGLSAPQVMTYHYGNAGSSPLLASVSGTTYAMTYDDVGRVTSDGGSTFTYDGFGRMLTQASSQSSSQFFYAADNLRVASRSTVGGSMHEVDYVYGLAGELLYEVNLTTQLAKRYVYVAGQLLASLESYPDTDADQDGLADEQEIEAGLNPLLAADAVYDADADGLPDWQERLWGLDPTNSDTDGDGDSDGYEYKRMGLRAAFDASIRSAQSEETHERCTRTKCWLIPVTGLVL